MAGFISILVVIMIGCLVMGIVSVVTRKSIYQERLESLVEKEKKEPIKKSPEPRVLLLALLERVSKLFAARSYTQNIQVELMRAGIPLRGEEYLTICLILIFVIPLLILLITANFWFAFSLFLIGLFIPKVYLNYKKNARIQKINQQLGDALIIMSNALRAGFGFQQAMDSARKELPDPISVEFNWTLREMDLGVSYEESLQNMDKRVQSDDLNMVVTGILIQRQVGGNLAEVLDNIAATIRERARIKGEVQVLTAQGRLSGIIIGLIPVALILAMLSINPDYLMVLVTDPRGLVIIGAAAFFQVVGIIMIRKMIDIEI
ncbi:Flp pilus assembly protein TadB [Candidatus Syntrophocurvum alkaliphilum]|uniref:Flp pilus assembly protein TadB n=1 Tax=Candidatus Syntrophocurvum alkaliphilum TaxID=2293317 RepID=A0A6I6DGI1_9FIRM|nr:type II secretion system F family protein [Candidatus Syntrophocurvum alkaliphilum]QGU00108.1 Flp pilus assembly protein TadB [Candidatus Syntrophocurvum alkaliphilum]